MVMEMYQIRLFGNIEVLDPQGELLPLPTQKVGQLLAFLWLNRPYAQPRAMLAGQLWPETDDSKARQSLRKALSDLRKLFDEYANAIFTTTRTTVCFAENAPCWIDVEQFDLEIGAANGADLDLRIQHLSEAIALYSGPFLQGLYEDWCVQAQDHYRQLYSNTLASLVTAHIQQKSFQLALPYAQKWVSESPLNGEAQRQLIYLYYVTGNRTAAVQQCKECRRILKEEIDADLLPETQALCERVLQQIERPTKRMHDLAPIVMNYPELGATFVGRDKELSLLKLAWKDVENGEFRIAFLSGEMGAGKTRLALEVANFAEACGGLALNGRCYDYEAPLPYMAWIEALRQACTSLTPGELNQVSHIWLAEVFKLVPEIAGKFKRIPKSQSVHSPQQERNRLFEGVAQFFTKISQKRPLILVLDDLQWASESTLQLLHYFTHRTSGGNVLLMGIYREEEVHETHPLWGLVQSVSRSSRFNLVHLDRLAKTEIEVLARDMLETDTELGGLVRQVFAFSKGNPLFAVEKLKSLIESGALYIDDRGKWQLSSEKYLLAHLPTTVTAIVQLRLRRLSKLARELLNLAVTRAKPVTLEFIAQILERPADALIDCLDELTKLNLLAAKDSNYSISHDVFREVAQQTMSAERKRALHLNIALVLESAYERQKENQGIVLELAQHFFDASNKSKALHYALLAGQQVWSNNFSRNEALAFFERAFELAKDLADEGALMEAHKGLGEVHSFTDEQQVGLTHSQKALELCRNPLKRAEIRLAIAHVYHVLRELERGLEECMHAIKELGNNTSNKTAAQVFYHASTFLNWLGRSDEAIEHCVASLKVSEIDDGLKALIHSEMGHAYGNLGDLELAEEYIARASHLAKKNRNWYLIGYSYFKLGMTYDKRDLLDDAIQAWDLSLKNLRKLDGFHNEIDAVYSHLISAYTRLKKGEKALDLSKSRLLHNQEHPVKINTAKSLATMACIQDELGSNAKAQSNFAKALDLAENDGYVYFNIILAYLDLDNVGKAHEWFQKGKPFLSERHIQTLQHGSPKSDAYRTFKKRIDL